MNVQSESIQSQNRPLSKEEASLAVAMCLFPKYDKTLILFPAIFTSCLNSGDFENLSLLIKSRVHHFCDIDIFGHRMNVDTAVCVFELLDELHPDSVYKCTNRGEFRGEIHAAINFQYTSSKNITQSVKRTASYAEVIPLLPDPQTNAAVLVKYTSSHPSEDQMALVTRIYTANELKINGTMLMNLQISSYSKKITHMVISCRYTGFHVVN